MTPDTIALFSEWAQILSVAAALIFGLYRIRKALDSRDNELEKRLLVGDMERDQILKEIAGFKSDLRKEFSGNSGGMREAINRISDTVERVDEKTQALAVEVADLRGRFEQHVDTGRSIRS
jgi:methyl-accepting chemotaxis protein